MTDNRTTELLPCPFCGDEATIERIGRSGYYYVACNTAYCCDFGKFDTESEAIAAWNTRADYHGYEQAAIEAWESIKAWNTRAELGSVTCELHDCDGRFSAVNRTVWRCDCGAFMTQYTDATTYHKPRFCPNCGARIRKAVTR